MTDNLLLGAVLLTAQGSSLAMFELEKSYPFQPEPIPVPVQFITQKDIKVDGDTLLHYHASLCGGCNFDGLMAHFAVNLVNNAWDDEKGDTITVQANDSVGNILATNLIGGKPVPDFNFTYHAK